MEESIHQGRQASVMGLSPLHCVSLLLVADS